MVEEFEIGSLQCQGPALAFPNIQRSGPVAPGMALPYYEAATQRASSRELLASPPVQIAVIADTGQRKIMMIRNEPKTWKIEEA